MENMQKPSWVRKKTSGQNLLAEDWKPSLETRFRLNMPENPYDNLLSDNWPLLIDLIFLRFLY